MRFHLVLFVLPGLTLSCVPQFSSESENLNVQGKGLHKICSADGTANARDTTLAKVLATLNNGDAVTPLGESKKNSSGTLYQRVKIARNGSEAWVANSLLCPAQEGSSLEQKFVAAGLVKLGGGIEVQLKYASTDNFLKTNVYGDLRACYLRKEVAAKMNSAQINLKKIAGPNATLVAYDCSRPNSVQQKMWNLKPDANYVANPATGGSKHSYGASVDLTFRNNDGKIVDMGTPFDYFGSKSGWSTTEITAGQRKNRQILRDAMKAGGLNAYDGEWWHFDGVANPKGSYSKLDF